MKSLVIGALFIWALIISVGVQAQRHAGFNLVGIDKIGQGEFNDMRNFYGATMVRLSFAKTPLFHYDIKTSKWSRNQKNYQLLDQKLAQVNKAGMKVVIDPHYVFGSANIYTLTERSAFWLDSRHARAWTAAVADLSGYLEKHHYKNVVWGIDLINEPASQQWRHNKSHILGQPGKLTKININQVYRDMVTRIRRVNKSHNLILMYFLDDFGEWDFRDKRGKVPVYVQSPNYYVSQLPTNDRQAALKKLIFSPHFYDRTRYTMQGLDWRKGNVKLESFDVDKEISKRFGWLESWRKKYGVSTDKIYVAEWGLTQGPKGAWNGNTQNPSNGGRKWMDKVYNAIKSYHWAIHQYGGNQMFDINRPPARRDYVRSLIQRTKKPSVTVSTVASNVKSSSKVLLKPTPVKDVIQVKASPAIEADAISSSGNSFEIKLLAEQFNSIPANYRITFGNKQLDGSVTTAGKTVIFNAVSTDLLKIQFLNDGWAGTASKDRNLIIESVKLNARVIPANTFTRSGQGECNDRISSKGIHLNCNGMASVEVKIPKEIVSSDNNIPKSISQILENTTVEESKKEIAVNNNSALIPIEIVMKGQLYKGSPYYKIFSNNTQLLSQGLVHNNYVVAKVTAKKGSRVTITFVNDLYEGSSQKDRNLLIAKIKLNNKTLNTRKNATISKCRGDRINDTSVFLGCGENTGGGTVSFMVN